MVVLVAVLIGAARFYRQAADVLGEVKSDVRDAVGRVRRADDAVRDVMKKAEGAAGQVVSLTRRIWPVLGIVSALRAGASALLGGGSGRPQRPRRLG